MLTKKTLWAGLTYVFAFLLSFAIVVAVLLETFRSAVDAALGTLSEELVSEEDGTLYSTFTPDAKYLNADGTGNSTALIKDAIDIGRRFSAEGSVLLKNENKTLPLAKGSKVTLLGARSETSIINAGMGQHSLGPYITLAQALSATKTDFAHTSVDDFIQTEYNFSDLKLGGDGVSAGAGFQVNDVVLAKYKELNTASKIQIQPRPKQGQTIYNPLEPARSEVEPSVTASKANFGDAAIVVVGRPGAEGGDYLKDDVIEGLGYERPLQLTKNERDAIELATDNFDKVIVLVNTSSAIEIGDLKKNDKIDAIMWIGHPGNYGFLGVADILCGNVSPSGGMSDIYATNNLSAPAMQNMGDYTFANASDIKRANSNKYIMEAEGIYVGYRYYETRYYDSVVNPSSNASSSAGATQGSTWNYADEVTYGFGYGLSYANLKYELVGTPTFDRTSAKTGKESGHEIYVDFTVKVTNDSDVPSMANVQIYGQAPYIMGTTKVEKPAIQLLDFGKTKTIPAHGSDTVTVKVDLQNIASYDSTYDNGDGTKGTYILDEGDYYFAVGNGAHDALNNIMKAQNHTPDDANANAALAWKWTYNYAGAGTVDGTTFGVSKNNVKVQNQLDYADWNNFSGASKVTYLSRTNWRDTYPVEYKDLTAPASMLDQLNGKYYTIRQDQDTSSFKWDSKETNIKFYEMQLAEFDDYRWEQMLSQMSIKEAIVFAAYGGDALPAVPSVGLAEMQGTENMGNGLVYQLSATKDPGAPWAIKDTDPAAKWNGQVFCSAPLMAATFDPDLLYEEGVFVGTEALFLGVPILWGPGLNTHRHAYNGRNCDYYSEDPVLSGVCALGFSMGCRDMGLIAAPKHFAFNDQETNRKGVAPYLTEQRAREVELRAFQIAFEGTKFDRERGKDTGMIGLMTSFSKIGPVECTCSYELQTKICVEEWGFHGYAVTDIYDDTDLFTAMAYSGSTGFDMRGAKDITWDSIINATGRGLSKVQNDGTSITEDLYDKDLDMMNALRASNKRYFWCIAQSNVMNRYNSTTHTVSHITWWRGTYIALIVVFSVLTAAGIALFALATVIGKKEA